MHQAVRTNRNPVYLQKVEIRFLSLVLQGAVLGAILEAFGNSPFVTDVQADRPGMVSPFFS